MVNRLPGCDFSGHSTACSGCSFGPLGITACANGETQSHYCYVCSYHGVLVSGDCGFLLVGENASECNFYHLE